MAIALAACGGGGDDVSPAPSYFNGTYTGSLVKTQDNCFIGGQYNGAVHLLAVDGPDVVVKINTLTLRGRPTDTGGLVAIYETSSEKVTTRATASYGIPHGTVPGVAFNTTVTIEGIDNATRFTCTLTYAGTVTRQ